MSAIEACQTAGEGDATVRLPRKRPVSSKTEIVTALSADRNVTLTFVRNPRELSGPCDTQSAWPVSPLRRTSPAPADGSPRP
ncbi:MAG: hypothetical protein IPL89_06580 [Acidobacteria bacterium]|nr:hypothetical protein [Acidobacteriota bacterium]